MSCTSTHSAKSHFKFLLGTVVGWKGGRGLIGKGAKHVLHFDLTLTYRTERRLVIGIYVPAIPLMCMITTILDMKSNKCYNPHDTGLCWCCCCWVCKGNDGKSTVGVCNETLTSIAIRAMNCSTVVRNKKFSLIIVILKMTRVFGRKSRSRDRNHYMALMLRWVMRSFWKAADKLSIIPWSTKNIAKSALPCSCRV